MLYSKKPTGPQILEKLNSINEEIHFLENLSCASAVQEESLEDLRNIRHELERKLNYDKSPTFKNDQANSKES